jgi:hypothetical protein
MALTEMLLSEETRRRLGDEGLAELAACLWSVDCQTCGTLLGDDPPALVVDDTYVTATASLHHQGCRSPEWNDSAVIRRAAGDYVSYVVRMMLIPVAEGRREAEPWPLMVVNPGLESVALARDKDGRWHVEHGAGFDGAGLVRPGRELRAGVSVGGAVARIMDSSVAVSFQVPPFTVYEAPAEETITGCARERGGVPGHLAAEDLYAVMGSGQIHAMSPSRVHATCTFSPVVLCFPEYSAGAEAQDQHGSSVPSMMNCDCRPNSSAVGTLPSSAFCRSGVIADIARLIVG